MSAHAYTAAEVEHIAKRLGGAGRNASGWDCRCPAHEDGKASLSLSIGKGGKLLWHCHAGCVQAAVLEGLKQANVLMNGDARLAEHKPQQRRRIVATYSYVDEHGAVLFEVVRYQTKDFRQRRPDGNGGYIWSLGDTRRVLYRLPEVLSADEVVIVEGEKDADRLCKAGFVATTSPQGAQFWRDELAVSLAGRRVAVIPDNDEAGRKHAQVVAAAARKHGATSVKLLDLGVQKKGGDASDWLDAGHTADELRDLIAKAPEFQDQEPHGVEDDGLALELGREWGNTARHVALWGRWLFWNGSRWEPDERLLHMTKTREFLRRKEIGDARTVARVVGLARSNPGQASSHKEWDADPWVLNTPGGIVDLRTGTLRPSDPLAYCTKSTAVAPAPPGTPTPLWDAFLERIFRHDPKLIDFMQRVLGYGLTGLTNEHVLVFAWGQGANGKGTLFNTASRIVGDYAAVAPADMLLVTHTDRHPADMAMLRGARFVTAQELAPGRAWDEPKLKSLTGGDPITARHMRQDFFTYDPQFLLAVAGNHKPSLKGVDEAIRRRLRLVPFLQNIPASERDKDLPEKLKAEWPGILRWMIDGCLAWQRVGLNPPETVTAATEEYLANEDLLGQWLADCCEVGRSHSAIRDDLYASWCEWAERNGAPKHSARAFYAKLDEKGFEQRKSDGKRLFDGLRLLVSGQEGQKATYRHVDRGDPPCRAPAGASTPYKGGSCPSCPETDETGAASNPNACIHCGEHCSPSDMANSIHGEDGRWHHFDCELAQP